MKIGVMTPTYNRPDLARQAVLQMIVQSRKPDVICVHQNGNPESYEWCIEDLRPEIRIIWIHTKDKIPQNDWYSVPLKRLLDEGCTHFFWADHDDIYLRHHIKLTMFELSDHDFSIATHCDMLVTRPHNFSYTRKHPFVDIHAPAGMSSSMGFTRKFAEELYRDITADATHGYTDQIVAKVTMPKFNRLHSKRHTTMYHSHEGSVSSAYWGKDLEKT